LSGQLETLRLKKRKAQLNNSWDDIQEERYRRQADIITQQLVNYEDKLDDLRLVLASTTLTLQEMSGKSVDLPLSRIIDFWYPNQMQWHEKMIHWLGQVWKFLSDDPRESNSEGGVFPAIFGTVLLVLIMSVIVMPLGVLVAIYLHEYAKNNLLTRMIRVAVINLAGVPSIVYGVFGLGFFVYTLGGSIDDLFYQERLPAPTFGSPGLLWSALTLAMLTLPVVIVTTEEGLNRIPNSVRHGSLALGATQFETLWRIVVPMASPAIITGSILAVARAAGEVAPLMLVGVVKLVSSLPVDAQFPFLHLERKFMHLGFHIYDIGFQTSNIEAARPLVYATSFLLVTVVISLNLTAIAIRNNLREKYRTLGHD
jgi:phosphate transport system permease protein